MCSWESARCLFVVVEFPNYCLSKQQINSLQMLNLKTCFVKMIFPSSKRFF